MAIPVDRVRGVEITGKGKRIYTRSVHRVVRRGMKFLAVERARETTMAGLVGVLRFALMETVTEMSTIKSTGLANHAFAYLRRILIYTDDVTIFPLLVIVMLICACKGTVSVT